jgi:hypothetical protein
MRQTAASKSPPRARSARPSPATVQRLSFTLDLATGRVDAIEAITAEGARRALAREERAALAKRKAAASLETIVEKAFIAGIDYVLGDEGGADDEPQSEAEQALLRPMIQQSAARRLVRREVLRQAVLADLVRNAASARPAGAASPRVRRADAGGKSSRRRS